MFRLKNLWHHREKGRQILSESFRKNIRRDYLLDAVDNGKEGDFVSIALGGDKRFKQAHIVKNFGKFDLNKATASLVLDKYDIPYVLMKNCQGIGRLSAFSSAGAAGYDQCAAGND